MKSILDKKEDFIYFTLHRRINTDSITDIQKILNLFKKNKYTILWPAHPKVFGYLKKLVIPTNFKIVKPLNYQESIFLISKSKIVITDSGGLQKEAYWLQKKCITLRKDTEWNETLKGNWNCLLKKYTNKDLETALQKKENYKKWSIHNFGKGMAANNIVKEINTYLCK